MIPRKAGPIYAFTTEYEGTQVNCHDKNERKQPSKTILHRMLI